MLHFSRGPEVSIYVEGTLVISERHAPVHYRMTVENRPWEIFGDVYCKEVTVDEVLKERLRKMRQAYLDLDSPSEQPPLPECCTSTRPS